ncbi:MAG: DUF1566 domain-containing protein [Mariprofundaceae bacterium]
MLSFILALASCGSGSSGTTTTTLPTLSIADKSVPEGSTGGATNLVFTATLSATSTSNVTVNYATSDGTALSASDYTATTASLSIPAGSTTGTMTVIVSADTTAEQSETLSLTLSSPTNATLGTSTATGTILNDDSFGLNDTGITQWGNATVNNLTVTQSAFPVQDADVGRDANATLNSPSDGKAGFSFTKLDSGGTVLANQTAVYSTTPWGCVQDNVTGLMWEVKITSGLRSKSHTYTWYNSTGINDGGNAGTANGGTCLDASNCDTEKYVAAVNALTGANRLCGYTDWRMPKVEELRAIVDYSIASPGPTIDTGYFPNAPANSGYWLASPSASVATYAWNVGFNDGGVNLGVKSVSHFVRLVRGGQ